MFWKSSQKEGKTREEKFQKNSKSGKVHHFHQNPEKAWSYYEVTAKSELNSLIKVEKRNTTSTADSSVWSATLEQFLKEEDEAMDVDEDNQDDFFFTPEGISRVPFSSLEVDLLGTSKHSSYFLGNSYIAEEDNRSYKIRATRRFQNTGHSQAYSHTPSNSPHQSPVK